MQCGRGWTAQHGDHRQEEYTTAEESHHDVHNLLNAGQAEIKTIMNIKIDQFAQLIPTVYLHSCSEIQMTKYYPCFISLVCEPILICQLFHHLKVITIGALG